MNTDELKQDLAAAQIENDEVFEERAYMSGVAVAICTQEPDNLHAFVMRYEKQPNFRDALREAIEDISRYNFIVDGRESPDYQRGWNDCAAITAQLILASLKQRQITLPIPD